MNGLRHVAAVALCAPAFLAAAQDVETSPAPPASPAPAAPVGKSFSFHQTSRGACVMQSADLVFDASGNGTVHLATMTTAGDDIWKARVRLRNVAGTPVFTSPVLNSPKMENKDGHPQTYHWSYSFKIDPTLLPSATQAEMVEIAC
jgi:hypothetical protein